MRDLRWSEGNDYRSLITRPTEAQSSHFIFDLFILVKNGRLREGERRLGKGQWRKAHLHFMISVEKAAMKFCCQESHKDGPHESLIVQSCKLSPQSLLWSAAQAGSKPSPQCSPLGLSLSPFLSVSLPPWGHASCSSVLLCPFQAEPLNLSPFVTLVYIWLVDGEPQEARGSMTRLRDPPLLAKHLLLLEVQKWTTHSLCFHKAYIAYSVGSE